MVLGEQASPAVPELTSLMLRTKDVDVVHRIVFCLAAVGKDGVPSLVAALQHPQLPGCRAAAYGLGINAPFEFGTNAAATVPLLAKLTSNTNEYLAKSAIEAIGRIHLEPQVAVPALTNALRSPSSGVQWEAEHAISQFGTNAICAVPLLVEALTNHVYKLRAAATNALLRIAPTVLTNVSRE